MSNLGNLPANNQMERKIRELTISISILGETMVRLRDEISGLIVLAEKILETTKKQNIIMENTTRLPFLTQEELEAFKEQVRLSFERRKKAR